jgi:hypothetical protein
MQAEQLIVCVVLLCLHALDLTKKIYASMSSTDIIDKN